MRTNDEVIAIIKTSLNKQDMSLSELARRVGMAKSAVSRYLNSTREFPLNRAEDFAKALRIDVEYLLGFEKKISNDITVIYDQLIKVRQNKVLKFATHQLQQQEESNIASLEEYKNRKKVPFPAYGSTGAGIGEELYDDILSEEVYFYEDEIPDTADFCIFVNGDSMEPALRQGTYCFIQNIQQLKDGLVALVIYDGTVLIKKIELTKDEIRLVSLNPKYEDITVKDHQQFKLVGKVVQ